MSNFVSNLSLFLSLSHAHTHTHSQPICLIIIHSSIHLFPWYIQWFTSSLSQRRCNTQISLSYLSVFCPISARKLKFILYLCIVLVEFPVHGTFKEDVECMSYQSIKCESPDLSIQSITEKSKYGR